jgi:hypothetical protein
MEPYLITSIYPPLPPPPCWSWHHYENGFYIEKLDHTWYRITDVVNDRSIMWHFDPPPDLSRLKDLVYIRGGNNTSVWFDDGYKSLSAHYDNYFLYNGILTGYFHVGRHQHCYSLSQGGTLITCTTFQRRVIKKIIIKVEDLQSFQVFQYLGGGRFVTENNQRELIYYDFWYDEKWCVSRLTLPRCVQRHILTFIIPDETLFNYFY